MHRNLPPRGGASGAAGSLVALAVVVIVVAAGAFQYLRPVPAVAPTSALGTATRVSGTPPALPWPTASEGTPGVPEEAAVAVPQLGLLGTSGAQVAMPIASEAKIMTALVILHDHPLSLNAEGPTVTVTPQDVTNYQNDLAENQSVVQVVAGEQLTELQLLEALLVPSGNNIAQLLADWDAGSMSAFLTKMQAEATALHLKDTHFADASGFATGTVSTAQDLVVMAEAAMSNPVFASIVGQAQVTLPVVGVAFNVDAVVGSNGIIGVKTGSTLYQGDPALPDSCFVFDSQKTVGGTTVQVFGAVLGVSSLQTAFTVSQGLISATAASLSVKTIVSKGQPLVNYSAPWGSHAEADAPTMVEVVTWPGIKIETKVEAAALKPGAPEGTHVGTVEVLVGTQLTKLPLVTSGPLLAPGKRWLLTRL